MGSTFLSIRAPSVSLTVWRNRATSTCDKNPANDFSTSQEKKNTSTKNKCVYAHITSSMVLDIASIISFVERRLLNSTYIYICIYVDKSFNVKTDFKSSVLLWCIWLLFSTRTDTLRAPGIRVQAVTKCTRARSTCSVVFSLIHDGVRSMQHNQSTHFQCISLE